MRYVWLLVINFVLGSCVYAEVTPVLTANYDSNAGVITFKQGVNVVTKYHVGKQVAKPYFYPLNATPEVPVTRGWPMVKGLPKETVDHVHQKSAWFCHGDVIPEGIELKTKSSDKRVHGVDFWAETAGHGKIECVDVGTPKATANQVSVVTKNQWKTPDGVNIMDETRTITLQLIGDNRLIVLDIDLHASVCPITFGDTKEGAMGVRVSDEMKVKGGNGTYVNAAGKKNEKEVWGYRSDWNNYYGEVNGVKAGIAVFDDPKNKFRAAWHSREYGLMAANPFGRKDSGFPEMKGKTDLVKLAKGEHLSLRYGMLLHTGDTQTGKVAESYRAFTAK